jgi:hypothetical protein
MTSRMAPRGARVRVELSALCAGKLDRTAPGADPIRIVGCWCGSTRNWVRLHGYPRRIITHRLFIKYFHIAAASQTVEWLDYWDIPYWDLCMVADKTAVGADLYIEDAPDNVRALRADGHSTIVFSNSTNKDLEEPRATTWADVMHLVRREMEVWKASDSARRKLAGE